MEKEVTKEDLAKGWAKHFKDVELDFYGPEYNATDREIHNKLVKKQHCATKVLIFASHLPEVKEEFQDAKNHKWDLRNIRKTRGHGRNKLSVDETWAYSMDFLEKVEILCDKLLSALKSNIIEKEEFNYRLL